MCYDENTGKEVNDIELGVKKWKDMHLLCG